MSPELPVQRSARERFVKACIKLGLPLNPRKRLVHADWVSSVGRRFRWKARSALPQTQRKVGTSQPKWLFSSDPWAGWYGRCNILQASEASRCLSHANFMLFHRTIQEHNGRRLDQGHSKSPTGSALFLRAAALCTEFCRNFAAKLAAMADARLAKEVAESPKLCQICQRSSLWCFFRSALVSRTVGLTSLSLIVQLLTCFPAPVATTVTRDSRTACRRWKAVLGGCACDRAFALSDVSAPHWEIDQWFSQRGVVDGWATRGRAKLGRAHVKARDVARVCGALALRCAEVWRIDSLRNLLELKHVQCSSCPTVTPTGTAAL